MSIILTKGITRTSIYDGDVKPLVNAPPPPPPSVQEEKVCTHDPSDPFDIPKKDSRGRRIYDKQLEKICIKCKKIRAKTDFGKNPDQPDGLQSYCKYCKGELGKRRRDKNVRARLRHHISTRVSSQLGRLCPENLTRDLEQYLGYRLTELVKHLTEDLKKRDPNLRLRQVLSDGWHVDHIYPLSRFKVLRDGQVDWEEFRRCWKIENLSAIPAEDNLKKGARVQEDTNRDEVPF